MESLNSHIWTLNTTLFENKTVNIHDNFECTKLKMIENLISLRKYDTLVLTIYVFEQSMTNLNSQISDGNL